MMITPQKLHAMKPEMITKIFLNQVETLYPSGDVGKQIGYDLGVHEKTFYNWRSRHNVPWAVVLLFQEWIEKQKPVEPPDPLVVAAQEMARAAQLMAEAMRDRADG